MGEHPRRRAGRIAGRHGAYSQLDADPRLLNCANGTVDLRTGELREHRREDLLTKWTPVVYDKDAQCPLFTRFVAEIMGDDPDLAAFLKRHCRRRDGQLSHQGRAERREHMPVTAMPRGRQAMAPTRQGRWEDAKRPLEEGLSLARSMPYPYAEARLLHVYGEMHEAKGEPEPARE